MLQNGAFFIIENNNYADFFLSLSAARTMIKTPVTKTNIPRMTYAAVINPPKSLAKTMPNMPNVIATTATAKKATISGLFCL